MLSSQLNIDLQKFKKFHQSLMNTPFQPFNNGLMHCWYHYTAHYASSYIAALAGIATCEQADELHNGMSYGIDFQDGETVFKVWDYAKEHGFIPEDDPIPHSALIYYAFSRKVCKKSHLDGGIWLINAQYKATLLGAKREEGLNLGRQ